MRSKHLDPGKRLSRPQARFLLLAHQGPIQAPTHRKGPLSDQAQQNGFAPRLCAMSEITDMAASNKKNRLLSQAAHSFSLDTLHDLKRITDKKSLSKPSETSLTSYPSDIALTAAPSTMAVISRGGTARLARERIRAIATSILFRPSWYASVTTSDSPAAIS